MEGLRYARGPESYQEAIPSSAFKRGDLLVYDSNSSLSRAPVLTTTLDIAGVAAADSTQSFNDRVPYLVPEADTIFFASIDTAAVASAFTAGEEVDIIDDGNDRPVVANSANTVRAVVQENGADVLGQDDSAISRVLVKLIRHAGGLEHS